MDFNAPTDIEYGGGRPTSFKSADGTWFVGALEKQGGGSLKLIVYHVDAAGKLLGSWAESGILGQSGLDLQDDGGLTACGYVGYGDNQTIRTIAVPGWKPWPSGGTSTLSTRYRAALDRLCAFLGI
jgi:hypothetical protein